MITNKLLCILLTQTIYMDSFLHSMISELNLREYPMFRMNNRVV